MRGRTWLVAVAAFSCGTSDEAPSVETTASTDAATLDMASPPIDAGSGGSPNTEASTPKDAPVGEAAPPAKDAAQGDAPAEAPLPCTLTDSGPVVVSADGQIVERLRITSTAGPAVRVQGHKNVVLRDLAIRHAGGPGIELDTADDVRIENVSVDHTGAPATGQNASANLLNISCYNAQRPVVVNVRLTRGSSGIYLLQCPSSQLSHVEGHDFRGPFPRGQLVQWDKSDAGLLEDFSVENPATSWPEDNVNMYKSLGMTVRRGLIDGNNSPSGIGVIFDGDTSTGLVEDVDAIHMGNGCFSDIAGADGNTFRRTRCRDNICTDQGRGVPSSNALMWCGKTGATQIRLEASQYYAACNPGNITWPASSFVVSEVTETDFTPRPPERVRFCWE
jgi:hypothetical protein